MTDENKTLLGLGALAVLAVAWLTLRGGGTATRAQWTRHITGPSIQGAALQAGAGMVTPNHLLWWGPPARPADWAPHRVKYPVTPGYELERLMYGAPGSCVTPNVPRAQRGWLFEPPSEVDY